MLRIGLSALEQGPVDTAATIAADDLLFEGLEFALDGAVRVTGQVSATGPGNYYWRGHLTTAFRSTCRRCLAPLVRPLQAPVDILFTEDHHADDPSIYLIPQRSATLDLSEAI